MDEAVHRSRLGRMKLVFVMITGIGVAVPTWGAGVVGTGDAGSCTAAALTTALAGGGLVTFNCGGAATIDVSGSAGTRTISTTTTVDGGGMITLSGGNEVGVFRVAPGGLLTVSHLTIASGIDLDAGGAIFNDDGVLVVSHCAFIANSASDGGAIFNDGGAVIVRDSNFAGNHAGLGIGAAAGGAIHNWGGTLIVSGSTFTENSAGGAVGRGEGAGIYNAGGAVTVTNSTFAANRANGDFRVGVTDIFNDSGAMVVTNTTLIGSGGAMLAGTMVLRNSIVASSRQTCLDAVIDGGNNIDSGNSCGFTVAAGSLTDTDPQVDPAGLRQNGGPTVTVALCAAADNPPGCAAASPALGSGDARVCVAVPVGGRDQRGFVRPLLHCSIGAYDPDAVGTTCPGDCDEDGRVAISELILGVNIALGRRQVDACVAFANALELVDVAQLVKGVNNALRGCPASD